MPKQLVCQNREESAVDINPSVVMVDRQQQSSSSPRQPTSTTMVDKGKSHRLGSFAFQPYQLFNPTPYASKRNNKADTDDVISNGSNHSNYSAKSSDSKELPINLMTIHHNAMATDRMSICNASDEGLVSVRQLPPQMNKPLSPPSTIACQPTSHVPSPATLSRTTTHLGSATPSVVVNCNDNVPQIKLPPTSMYPYTKQQQPSNMDNNTTAISPPTLIQPLPPLPSINSLRCFSKAQKQGFASPKTKAKKGLTAHLVTNSNYSAFVNSGSTKAFGSSTSTSQNFYASPMKSVDNSNPYTISSLTIPQNENVNNNNSNILNNTNQTTEKKEAPPVKPVPKLPFGTLSLMN